MEPEDVRVDTNLSDPDPFTLAALIIAALAATAGIGSFTINISRNQKEKAEAERKKKNALLDAVASLKQTEGVFQKFVSYLDRLGFRETQFKTGSKQIIGDRKMVESFKQMVEDLLDSIRKLNDTSIELADLLDEAEALKFRDRVDRFDLLIKQAFASKSYGTFIQTTSLILEEMKAHLQQIASSYDLRF